MKPLFILCTLLSFSTCQAQQSFHFDKDHDALLVKDVNASAQFYIDIFGLEEIYDAGLGERFRWFQLNDKVQLHLIQSPDDFQPHKGVHLAINTPQLDEFMTFLKSKNVHFESWQGEANTFNTRPDGIRQIYLQDPDGYWIEVNDNKL